MSARGPAPGTVAAPPTPERIMQMTWGFAVTRSLCAALDVGLFTKIAEGKRTADALAKALEASPRGVGMLLNALVALGLLTRAGSGASATYGLAPDADLFLVKGRPSYIGDFILFHGTGIEVHWQQLTACVKTGKPVVAVDKPAEGIPLWHDLVDSLFNVSFLAGTQVGKELLRLHPTGNVRILDVASGSGVWGIAAATVDPRIRVVSFDLPETLPHARRNAARAKLGDHVEFWEGDLRTMDLGERAFEAAILGHIVHSEGATHSQTLFAKVARALKPGGTIVIADFVPDAGRDGPPGPLLFALNMLVHTSDGDTYTFPEYEAWLTKAGFKDVRQMPAASVSPLILATRL